MGKAIWLQLIITDLESEVAEDSFVTGLHASFFRGSGGEKDFNRRVSARAPGWREKLISSETSCREIII